jgi:hypothetical protein
MSFKDYQPRERREFLSLQQGDNKLIIVSDIFVEIQRHFQEGRMEICLGAGCPLCAQRIPKRTAYYFYVKTETGEIKILRVGRTIMDNIKILKNKIPKLNHINIIKSGEKLTTKYVVLPGEPPYVEIPQEEIKKLEPLQNVLARVFNLDIEEIQ